MASLKLTLVESCPEHCGAFEIHVLAYDIKRFIDLAATIIGWKRLLHVPSDFAHRAVSAIFHVASEIF